jgi:exo-beta-1,3-glucanase (GH17 family)/DNA-binding beta-propeller fold protein YncE
VAPEGALYVLISPQVCAAYRLHGLDFSPYIAPDEDPALGAGQITPAELRQRIERVAPRTRWLRTFACNQDLRDAGRVAHGLGLQVALGAQLGTDPVENQSQVDCLIEEALAGHADVAVVGSEVLLRGDLGESELLGFLEQVRTGLVGSGHEIPVTTAEVYSVLLDHPALLDAVDQVFVNYYPYWEGRGIDLAMAHVHRWHQQMQEAAPGKAVVVSETGWPSCGDILGDAIPSPANAAYYFRNFVSWARANEVEFFYFEAFDEAWKAAVEGPQGACWGLWEGDQDLKEGMQAVFDGEVLPDNWSDPPTEEPLIDFAALPETTTTNLSAFLVAGATDPANVVLVDGTELSGTAINEAGDYAVVVPLSAGANPIELRIESPAGDLLSEVTRTVTFDPNLSTVGDRLLYVDVVDLDGDLPRLSGTVVLDLDGNGILGVIEDEHVRGIAPDGREIYTAARTVISTGSHRELRTLPFTRDVPSNGFQVSPDGERLYARDEIVDVGGNQLLPDRLPLSIETSGSYSSAPIPGDPALSVDGRSLYCRSDVTRMDPTSRTVQDSRGSNLAYETDLALTPDGSALLVANYSFAAGRVFVYDASNLGTLLHTVTGLGDFAGEIAFSADGSWAVIGSAGNPSYETDGRVAVIDLGSWQKHDQLRVPLADNLATSGNNEFFVASGQNDLLRRLGIQVLVLSRSGTLERAKTFFLGINRFEDSSGEPSNDRIRKIVFKPAADG